MPALDRRKETVLVIGCGSIGRRHIANLQELGISRIAGCDTDPERLSHVESELGITGYEELDAALDAVSPDMVIVSTPPCFHVPQALASVRSGAHVLIEKPLSHSLEGVDDLIRETDEANRVVQVGYNFRFHPGLQMTKDLVDKGAIGRVLWASTEAGLYLPDWRPWQDYRQGYTAHRSQGGGIILDGSHEIDYLRWMLGEVEQVYCLADTLSDLEVDAEDAAFMILRFASGCIGQLQMDFVQRAYVRNCKIVGTEGTIIWDFQGGFVDHYTASQGDWRHIEVSPQPNEMYMTELESFLENLGNANSPASDLRSAKRVLEIVMAARESASTRRAADLPARGPQAN